MNRVKDRTMCAESNAFAFALLMPADWLRRDIMKMGGIDIEDEDKLAKLCKMYRVSMPMMILRIGQVMK